MEQVSRRHFERKGMKVTIAYSRHGHYQSGFEEPHIPYSVVSAVKLNLLYMEVEDFGKREKIRHLTQSASFLKVVSYFLLILARIFVSFSSRFTSNTGESVKDFPSVEIEIGVSTSMFSNSRIGLSSISAKLLPCFVKVFITGITPFYKVNTMYHEKGQCASLSFWPSFVWYAEEILTDHRFSF
jgi:hypothetical protein